MTTRTIESETLERRALNDPDDQFLYVVDGYGGRVTEKILMPGEPGIFLDVQEEFERAVGQVILQHIPLSEFRKIEQVWGQLYDVNEQQENMDTDLSEDDYSVAYHALGEQEDRLVLELQEVVLNAVKA